MRSRASLPNAFPGRAWERARGSRRRGLIIILVRLLLAGEDEGSAARCGHGGVRALHGFPDDFVELEIISRVFAALEDLRSKGGQFSFGLNVSPSTEAEQPGVGEAVRFLIISS